MSHREIQCLCNKGNKCKFTLCKKYQKEEREQILSLVRRKQPITISSATVLINYKMVEKEGRTQPFKTGVELFNVGRKWWLKYSGTRCTGSFKSKYKAIAWYMRGGR